MKRFPINFTVELLNWLIGQQAGYGFTSTSSFIRHIIIRFKNQENSQRWTDADMMDWGRHLLVDDEGRLKAEFNKFKSTK